MFLETMGYPHHWQTWHPDWWQITIFFNFSPQFVILKVASPEGYPDVCMCSPLKSRQKRKEKRKLRRESELNRSRRASQEVLDSSSAYTISGGARPVPGHHYFQSPYHTPPPQTHVPHQFAAPPVANAEQEKIDVASQSNAIQELAKALRQAS